MTSELGTFLRRFAIRLPIMVLIVLGLLRVPVVARSLTPGFFWKNMMGRIERTHAKARVELEYTQWALAALNEIRTNGFVMLPETRGLPDDDQVAMAIRRLEGSRRQAETNVREQALQRERFRRMAAADARNRSGLSAWE